MKIVAKLFCLAISIGRTAIKLAISAIYQTCCVHFAKPTASMYGIFTYILADSHGCYGKSLTQVVKIDEEKDTAFKKEAGGWLTLPLSLVYR